MIQAILCIDSQGKHLLAPDSIICSLLGAYMQEVLQRFICRYHKELKFLWCIVTENRCVKKFVFCVMQNTRAVR